MEELGEGVAITNIEGDIPDQFPEGVFIRNGPYVLYMNSRCMCLRGECERKILPYFFLFFFMTLSFHFGPGCPSALFLIIYIKRNLGS